MILISDDNEKQLKDLKEEIDFKLDNLSEIADDETVDKFNKINDSLKDNYSSRSQEENLKHLNNFNKGLSFYESFKQSLERDIDIDPGRLLGLSDGIFGMVMTLLVFGMALPGINLLTEGDFLSFLMSLLPTFGVTIVSFILVSSFWIYHHEFMKIKNLNIPLLWLNIFFLACISFIPFSTSIIGTYSRFFLANVIFGINILLTIVFFLLMFRYAYNRGFLDGAPSQNERKYVRNTFLIIMILTVVVNLLDFKVSSNFIYLFLLVPVISTIRDIRFKMQS